MLAIATQRPAIIRPSKQRAATDMVEYAPGLWSKGDESYSEAL